MRNNHVCLMAIELDHCLILGQCPGWVALLPGMIAHVGQLTGVIRECITVAPESSTYKLFCLLYGKPEEVSKVCVPAYTASRK